MTMTDLEILSQELNCFCDENNYKRMSADELQIHIIPDTERYKEHSEYLSDFIRRWDQAMYV